MEKKITKHCVSCEKDGHTYLECKKLPFIGLMAGVFGLTTELYELNDEEQIENINDELG